MRLCLDESATFNLGHYDAVSATGSCPLFVRNLERGNVGGVDDHIHSQPISWPACI